MRFAVYDTGSNGEDAFFSAPKSGDTGAMIIFMKYYLVAMYTPLRRWVGDPLQQSAGQEEAAEEAAAAAGEIMTSALLDDDCSLKDALMLWV